MSGFRRIANLFCRSQVEREIEAELRSHLEMRMEDNVAAGMSPAEARRNALLRFGNPAVLKERVASVDAAQWIENLLRDLRHALRRLRKSPVFTIAAILTLAVGIGANTAIFSLMKVMLYSELPVKDARQLVEFIRVEPAAQMTNLPYSAFSHLQKDRQVLADIFAIIPSQAVVHAGTAAEKVNAHWVSASFFPALGISPLAGRTLGSDGGQPGVQGPTVVLSYSFWSRRFGRDPSILGTVVRIDGELFAVVGVMPPRFFGFDRAQVPDLWLPLPANSDPSSQVWVLGHLKPGISIPQAQTALQPLFRASLESLRQYASTWPAEDRDRFLSETLVVDSAADGPAELRWNYWEYSNTLKILIGLSGLVLLIACASLANLFMARTAARRREIGVRLALGAGRWHLVRQLLIENFLLSLVGGAAGLFVAGAGHRLLLDFLVRDPKTVALDFRLDYGVLSFGLALSVATGLLFGLLPALRAARVDAAALIRGGNCRPVPTRIPFARSALMLQAALSTLLLIGAGLFTRSLTNLYHAGLGLEREHLLLMDVQSPGKPAQDSRRFWAQLSAQVSAIPGVQSAALGGDAVFGNGGWNQTAWIERNGQPALAAQIADNVVSPGFFSTVGMPVLMGRDFGEQDRENAPRVALVNQTFVRRFYASDNPLGKCFCDSEEDPNHRYEIVGVVGDAKYGAVREPMQPMIFHPLLQEVSPASLVLHVRTTGGAGSSIPSILRQIQAIDPDVLVTDVRTLPQVVQRQLRHDRMFATLASFFALVAVVLGAIGIYGMVAYRAAHRTTEIAVRMALGAERRQVLWLVTRETIAVIGTGIAIGLLAAFPATRLIQSELFGLQPSDPITIACAGSLLLTVGALAAFLPARKAVATEPMPALRME